MESHDAEFSGPGPAERKAQEAKAAESPLTPLEKFVTEATKTNFQLFKRALDEAVEQTVGCFNEDWIPEGDPSELMQRMDSAKNFLVLADTYFTALARPLMQAGAIAISHQMLSEALAPREPSAEERGLIGHELVGKRIITMSHCRQGDQSGIVTDYDSDDDDYLIKLDSGQIDWHSRSCFTLEK